MRRSAAIDSMAFDQIAAHVLRDDGQEDVCFALWHPSRGRERLTHVVGRVVLPADGDRQVHGNASFNGEYFLRAASVAQEHGAGLALVHSHPHGRGWQGMSDDDVHAERSHAAQALELTGRPLLGLTVAGDESVSARVWERAGRRRFERHWCQTVRVVGDRLALTVAPHGAVVMGANPRQERSVAAWGPHVQRSISQLRVGVVGAGSVGALVAEALARTGVAQIVLMDFDGVEEVNLDRLLHATRLDARLRRSKVETLARGLTQSATADGFSVEALEHSVVEEAGFMAALDCDVLFSCVDRPWPRHALNVIASAHLIPVVDGGVAVRAARGRLVRADWRAHVAAPGRRCLTCLGQYDVGEVSVERQGLLDDPTYIEGLDPSHPARRRENVFAFSAAVGAQEVLQLLTAVVRPGGVGDFGAQHFHFVGGGVDIDVADCEHGCPFAGELRAVGDDSPSRPTGRHPAAEQARADRVGLPFGVRARRRIDDWLWSARRRL